jgi:hypothetical protein
MRQIAALLLIATIARADSSTPDKQRDSKPPLRTPAHGQPSKPWQCELAKPIPPEPVTHCWGADQSRGDRLHRCEIAANITRVKGHVMCCFERYRVAGLAKTVVTVSPDGRPTQVKVHGDLENTPTAACIETAVRFARFPTFDGAALSFAYPFTLK